MTAKKIRLRRRMAAQPASPLPPKETLRVAFFLHLLRHQRDGLSPRLVPWKNTLVRHVAP